MPRSASALRYSGSNTMRAGTSASPLCRGMPNLVGKSLCIRAIICISTVCDIKILLLGDIFSIAQELSGAKQYVLQNVNAISCLMMDSCAENSNFIKICNIEREKFGVIYRCTDFAPNI